MIQKNITPDAARDAGQTIQSHEGNITHEMRPRTTPRLRGEAPRVNIYRSREGGEFNLLVNYANATDAARYGFTPAEFAHVASFTPTAEILDGGQPRDLTKTAGHAETYYDAPTIKLPPKTHGPVTRATHCRAPLVDRVEINDAQSPERRLTLERVTLATCGIYTKRQAWPVTPEVFNHIRATLGFRN